MPVGKFVVACGDKALQMLESMEERDRLVPLTFKTLENVTDHSDYKQLLAEMSPELGRPSAAKMKTIIMGLLRRRWWNWLILHPEITDSMVHPSRSVSHLCSPCCLACFFF